MVLVAGCWLLVGRVCGVGCWLVAIVGRAIVDLVGRVCAGWLLAGCWLVGCVVLVAMVGRAIVDPNS